MKLERFKKNGKRNKKLMYSVIGILFVVGTIALFSTFAFYEEKKEFNVLKGRVPNFGYDIKMLSVVVDNEEVQEIPEKGDYGVEVECSEGKGSWDYQNWSLNLTEFQKHTKCNITFKSGEKPDDSEMNKKIVIPLLKTLLGQINGGGTYYPQTFMKLDIEEYTSISIESISNPYCTVVLTDRFGGTSKIDIGTTDITNYKYVTFQLNLLNINSAPYNGCQIENIVIS